MVLPFYISDLFAIFIYMTYFFKTNFSFFLSKTSEGKFRDLTAIFLFEKFFIILQKNGSQILFVKFTKSLNRGLTCPSTRKTPLLETPLLKVC